MNSLKPHVLILYQDIMSHYETLGVEKNAGQDEIKKAYYKMSKSAHPDKGGDAEEFKKINHAYEVLSNPEKRQMYDMTGSDGEDGGGGMPNMGDMFMGGNPFGFGGIGAMFSEMFGGMGGPPGRQRRAPRGPDKSQDIPLSLADFYNGRDIQIKFHQQRGCGLCKASGALKSEQCGSCRGQGVRMVMRQIGPGMIQQSVQKCSDCTEGQRVLIVCHECSGKKYKTQEKALNARIEPGMPDGEKLRFIGECSDAPEYERPGDVILNLLRTSSGSDSEFDWQGSDLHITHSVEMAEALLGFHAQIKDHPSGKEVALSWGGGPLQHDAVLVAKGLGMPVRGRKGEFGDLFVHIDVAVSAAEKKAGWTKEQRATLRSVFPEWNPPKTGGVPLNFQMSE
jgi:DnaJ homolog subfamily A member 2